MRSYRWPIEVTVSAIASVRDVRAEGQYGEVDLTVKRGIRLPGRARLDRAAGRYGVVAARNRAEDVQHQAALMLNQLW
jgi:outer membrane protein, heavy metal efflux system